MATLIEIIILAIIQGITEWLPISSSGHLVLAQEYFKTDPSSVLVLDVFLHAGTLIVILVVFREDIANILRALKKRNFASEDGRLTKYIVVGTIPTAVVGYVFHDEVQSLFSNPLAVSVALLFTGMLLFVSEWQEGSEKLGFLDSLFIGLAQAVSLIPGISRSGSTISTGLVRGVDKQKVFKFSFLLAAPAILGATVYEAREALSVGIDWAPLILGAFISMIVGYVALKALLKIVLMRKFHYFAYYCWAVGLIVLFLLLAK